MFIIINNKSFKSTELRVSNLLQLSTKNLEIFGYCYHHQHSDKEVNDDKNTLKILNLLLDKGYISVEELGKDDSRNDYSKTDSSKCRFYYDVSSTEFVLHCISKVYLIKHPDGHSWFFYFKDDMNFEISKLYSSEEECREAWERLQTHCNKIVFELPREEV